MNTPTIAAALASPPAQPGRTAGNSSDAESGTSFSHVLGDQHAALEQQARTTAQAQPAPGGKTAQAAKPKAEAQDTASEADLAGLAGEQGMSLPQIALSLAAHVLTGTNQDPADQPKDPGAVTQTQVQALPRGKADLAALIAKTTVPAQSDAAAKTGAQVPRAETATSAGFSVAGAGEPQLALSTPVAAETAAPNTRAAAAQLRSSAADGGQAIKKPADPAAQIASSAQNLLGANATAQTPAILPDSATAANSNFNTAATFDIASLASSNGQAQITNSAALSGSSLGVSTPLQNPQWPSDFGRQFVMLTQNAGNQPQTAELRLDPPELGPIRITININDNVAHAVFVSAHASVRNAIENALPQLQQQLAQAGISLGQTNVSDQGQQQSPFEQSSQSAGKHTDRAAGSTATVAGLGSAVAQASARATQNPNSLVDTFA